MYKKYQNSYYASEFSEFLKKDLVGANAVIYEPVSVNNIKNNSILFIDNIWHKDFPVDELNKHAEVLLVTNKLPETTLNCSYILTENPRLDYIRILNQFFLTKIPAEINSTAIIHPSAKIGKNVSIGSHVVIGPDVVIGENSVIMSNVVISGIVHIGKDCVIKANSTIGSEGFSFTFDENHNLEHFPQVGEIIIEDRVWIGSNSSVERATLDATHIHSDVKIDDLVQIGHNAIIGKSTQITAGCIISGRVKIGENCWIAPNVTIDNAVKIHNNSMVGMGAVVLEDVPASTVVVGVPAKAIRKRT